MPSLPAGFHARPATVDDAEAIFAVQAAHNVPIIGDPDGTLDDVRDELVEPGFDLATDGWLVLGPAGEAVGWGWVCRKGVSDNVDIAVYLNREAVAGVQAVAEWLWQRAELRARDIVRELGHSSATIDCGSFRGDGFRRGLAKAHGFAAATTFIRMRIDHEGTPADPVPYPDPPAGVELRNGTESEQVRRDGHAVQQTAFADHFGFAPKSFETWKSEREASSAHDWALLDVAYRGDTETPAAVIYRTNHFVPDENCGYVLTLGADPRYQGRGLGSYLLRYAFAADAELGRAGTILHVDTNPERPALGIYLRNGMREILTIDIWRKVVPT